ncbi:hypothetical protein C2G38_2140284 [Gigaspora rosea]|uniref:Uncharacterized protein n=1 Tax=Gigaspora rosea TaxID=44941 RepID=A0A397VLT4_9GLOM|nr:hypothetical protein C2G38_2140284 [Gigaspora rosea]
MNDTHELNIVVNDEVNDKVTVGSKKQKDRKKQIQQENLENKNYFYSGWALKENQMYGKKGEGKRMTETVKEILKSFFHAGDEDKSEQYTAKNMLQDLQQREQIGELETEEIPQLKTIENWISRYSSLHKKEAAKKPKQQLQVSKVLNKKNGLTYIC